MEEFNDRNREGTVENQSYCKLENDIKENISTVWIIADAGYGTIEGIIEGKGRNVQRILNEREIFVKGALETLNQLSLKIAIGSIEKNDSSDRIADSLGVIKKEGIAVDSFSR